MKLSEAAARLRAAGITEPMLEARLLFSRFGGLSDAALYGANPQIEDACIEPFLCRREKREPMAYILGEQGFYRETYCVTPDTLIPREDTEILVDYAVRHLKAGARFADLCTGSGCIALSVLNNTAATSALAVDISKGALAVARENAQRLSLSSRVHFLEGDVLSKKILEALCEQALFDAILCNPPYVSEKMFLTLAPEIFFEPKSALVSAQEGMLFYRRLTPVLLPMICEGGFLAFEIGYDQGARMQALAEENGCTCALIKDLSGNTRLAVLRRS